MLPQHSKLDQRVFSRYLAPDEVIVDVIHRHWFGFVWPLTKTLVIGFFLPAIIFILFPKPWWLILILSLYVVFAFAWLWYVFHDWFSDVFILTDQDVLLVDWENPFNFSSSRIEYEQIEAVTHDFSGIIQTVFKFGTLELTTPNATHTLKTVKRPQKAQDRLMAVRDAYDEQKNASDDDHVDFDILRRALKSIIEEDPGDDDLPAPPEPPKVNDIIPPAE